MSATLRNVIAALAAIFGIATLMSGATALFGGAAGRAFAGNAVPFVLWFNFLAGFAYVLAAAAIWRQSRFTFPLALAIGAATLLVFALFALAVASGVAHETRTFGAMTLRSAFWLAVAWIVRRNNTPSANKE